MAVVPTTPGWHLRNRRGFASGLDSDASPDDRQDSRPDLTDAGRTTAVYGSLCTGEAAEMW
jgi:hypothetical protein